MMFLGFVDTLMAPLVTGTLMAQLVDDGYVPDPADAHLADVDPGARVGDPVEVTAKSVTGGELHTGAPVTFADEAAGDTVTGIVVYRDSGSEATSELVCHYDRRADTVPIDIGTNGGDIVVTWPGGRLLKL